MFWSGLLALSTFLMLPSRVEIKEAHPSLVMLLVVLGGSIAGGRALGFTLAVVSTLLIDYYFQPPYELFVANTMLDWVVLLAFLATAFVATELLTRARQQAVAAEARASEVEALSRLGAESLQYATAEQALEAIAGLVQRAMGADACTIVPSDVPRSSRGSGSYDVQDGNQARHASQMEHEASARAIRAGRPVFLGADNVLREHANTDISKPSSLLVRAQLLALPLRAEERIIGVLVVRGDAALVLDAPRRRLLAALGYYAALGIERMRLMAEAAQAEALRESQRIKNEFFASVSHDLRTPLTTIKVLAQSGAERGEPSSIAIAEQAERLARMVGDLLEVSALRTGSFSLTPELNTAEDLVGAALRQAEGILNGRRIDVQIDFDSPALVGRFDFVHTLRIVGNLLDNALRHTPEGGIVELRAERHEQWLVLTVADRGSGVASFERDRIFEPFYRPADATPDTGHSGLGLSIARSLAEVQGGTVSFEARAGGGSIFALRLPAADIDMNAGDMNPGETSVSDIE
jgi:two-component system sensor histidine kinase KdpD